MQEKRLIGNLGGWYLKNADMLISIRVVCFSRIPKGESSMSAEVLYRAMGVAGYWVVDVWESRGGEIQLLVEPPRESLRCRACRSRRVHVHERRLRSWKDTPYGWQPVNILMQAPRVRCLNCGAKTWHQPKFAEGQKRYTKNFEKFVCGWLSRVTIQDVVETCGLSWDSVADMDRRRLQRLGRPELRSLKRLAIDEVYVGKLHRFLTLVYDLDSGAIVSVSQGRGQKALTGFFSRLKRAGVTIQAVATDMASGYIAAVMKHLWPTQLVFDRFHVMKLMNDKLSTLRREMYRELKDVQRRDVLKGIRWLLLKNPENLKQTPRGDERSRLAEALKLNEPLAQAYYLKDDLRQFWQQSSKAAAANFLEDWCRRAEATGIRVLRTMSHTLRGHRVGLLNWYDHPISTSPLEGTNNKIGLLQRRAYGYRRYDHFKQRLLTLHHAKFTLAG
jgi:transposase